jgi:acetylornithine deacetylase/succinyl-diaminopimelate desuccinylase-like protein
MSRKAAVSRALRSYDNRLFHQQLARRIAIPTESQNPLSQGEMYRYLEGEIGPEFSELGYTWQIHENKLCQRLPFLIARRPEAQGLPTVLTYGHADVVHGMTGWADGLSPWTLTERDGKLYGRGTADNKGQHTICMLALRAVMEERGKLGFNSIFLMDTGEEVGSPGLYDLCQRERESLRADVLIASDGPRLHPDRPMIYAGTRGCCNFALEVRLRQDAHHSGNHGGLLASASLLLANAISRIVDGRGVIRIAEWRNPPIPSDIRAALAEVPFDDREPPPDEVWGEPGLSPLERLVAWNSFEVLAITAGNPSAPVNAIPPTATAHCSLRYTVDTSPDTIIPALRRSLDDAGFQRVIIVPDEGGALATRLSPTDPWMKWAAGSVHASVGKKAVLLPNEGGTLPNDAFAITLGARTLWIPHSYTGCSQHAPNEHLLAGVAREGLAIMAGLFWDVGAEGVPPYGATSSKGGR